MECEETGNNENAERVNGERGRAGALMSRIAVSFHLDQGWRKRLAARCVALTRAEAPDITTGD